MRLQGRRLLQRLVLSKGKLRKFDDRKVQNTWCVQVLRSPKEAFAAAMQSRRERCENCVCLQGDYVEK